MEIQAMVDRLKARDEGAMTVPDKYNVLQSRMKHAIHGRSAPRPDLPQPDDCAVCLDDFQVYLEREAVKAAPGKHPLFLVTVFRCPGGECEHDDCTDLGEMSFNDYDMATTYALVRSSLVKGTIARVHLVDTTTGDAREQLTGYIAGTELEDA